MEGKTFGPFWFILVNLGLFWSKSFHSVYFSPPRSTLDHFSLLKSNSVHPIHFGPLEILRSVQFTSVQFGLVLFIEFSLVHSVRISLLRSIQCNLGHPVNFVIWSIWFTYLRMIGKDKFELRVPSIV